MTQAADEEPLLFCPYDDDSAISDDEILYRRLPTHHLKDQAAAPLGYRYTSNSFHDPDPMGVSVYMKSIFERLGLTADDVISDQTGLWGVAETTVSAARAQGFGVRSRPDPDVHHDPRNEAHGELTGLRKGKDGQRQAKNLAKPPTVLVRVRT